VATATAQLSRSLGATIGIAIFGTIMTSNLKTEVPRYLPADASSQASHLSGSSGVRSVLSQNVLSKLPAAVVHGIREGLPASMHPLFAAGVLIVAVAFVASLCIKELPLRTTSFAEEDEGTGIIKGLNQRSAECLRARDRHRSGAPCIVATSPLPRPPRAAEPSS
jgi:hypothetical protein